MSAIMLTCSLIACGQVQREAPTTLHSGGNGAGGAGAAGDGGAFAASEGGSDADAESDAGGAGITISGTLIDSWRRPVAGAQVALGAATAVTGAQGQFRFEQVTPPYDLAFSVPGLPYSLTTSELWLYTGLTRADPTLQFDHVLVDQQRLLRVTQTNVPTPATNDGVAQVGLWMSFAAPGFEVGEDLTQLVDGLFGVRWSGGASLEGSLHSLAWLSPSGDRKGLDLQFLSYQQRAFTLDNDSSSPVAQVTVDFSPNTVPTVTYPVAITGEPFSETVLRSALVFDSHATIRLTVRQNPDAMSNVPMPVLADAHAVFTAARTWPETGAGFVHRRADSAATVTELTIPTPRTLIAPAEDASITATTRFEWSDGAGVSKLYVYCPKSAVGVHVVTATNSATWPEVPALSSFPNDSTCLWAVSVHGTFASVDDAAGPNGFLDACTFADYCDRGPVLGDGSSTQSISRSLITAP